MAPGSRQKLPMKRPLEPRREHGSDDDLRREVQGRMRTSNEQRSKARNDVWAVQRHTFDRDEVVDTKRAKEKGKAVANTSALKRRRRTASREEYVEEDLSAPSSSSDDSARRNDGPSNSDETEEEEDDTTIVEKEPITKARRRPPKKMSASRKQYIEVDKRGYPHGKPVPYFIEDVKLLARGLNPVYNWAHQPLHEKQRFFARLYADWEVIGEQSEINPQWFPNYVTKALINFRYQLMKFIDAGKPKPPEVDDDVWKALQARRQSEKYKDKSDQMRAISKGRGSKEAQLRIIEKTMIGELTLRLGRIPYETEVEAATFKEYARRRDEEQKPTPDVTADISEVRASTSEMGERLARVEELIKQLMDSLGAPNVQHQFPSSAPNGTEQVLGSIGNAIVEYKTGLEETHPDVVPDTGVNASVLGDALEDATQDAEEDVNYLKDNVSDSKADHNANEDASAAINPTALETDQNKAPTPIVHDVNTDVSKDAAQSTGELTDPYSIVAEEVVAAKDPAPAPIVETVTQKEVANLPSSGSSSRSNRVTRTTPSTKATKFAPPAKTTKTTPAKVSKASPPKVTDQMKKGEAPRKK